MVYMFFANGFEETEAICPLDLLRRAGVQVTTVGIGSADIIRGSHGLTIKTDITDSMYDDPLPEMLILPGGGVGTDNLHASVLVDALLNNNYVRNESYIAAICAAPSLLGRRGLLNGKHAVCYPGFERFLDGCITEPDARVVVDGKIITAVGMGASEEFGLTLISLLAGKDKAEKIRRQIIAR